MDKINYNPDVLSCLANLSNDEVFTPPSVVNQMLDMLPPEIWSNKQAKFLDPVCKSGVFLREIAKRLIIGLERDIPDLQTRINHIFTKQIYGIAITELTSLLSRRSLYCSKVANGKYSVTDAFKSPEGNILFNRIEHAWKNGKCEFCGASKEVYERDDGLEKHAYQFIHTENPEELFDMKFDVIVGNPPYQLTDAGFGTSATAIYDRFVSQAKKLNPRYLTMIIPARWFSGGKGLDEFRNQMLLDNRLTEIHDYPEASDCFPGVQIKGGVCFFLWDRDNPGLCRVSTYKNGKLLSSSKRPLLEEGCETFIRFNEAISILKKVQSLKEPTLKNQISARKPFGLPTTFKGKTKATGGAIKIYQNGGVGYISFDEISSNKGIVEKYKVLIPPLGSGSDSFPHPILGKPFVAEPGTACTETYLVAGSYSSAKQEIL
jgi:site-specific DNA-methyltransferase (adenine-specific)